MKTKILFTALMIAMITNAISQNPFTLTFTADSNAVYVPLDSILIENLTQGGDTTLYAPDTVLVLDYVTGLEEINTSGGKSFSLSQNYPNPMVNKTTVSLWLPERNDILITISDVVGREVVKKEFQLEEGAHTFNFYPGRESLYFLTVLVDRQSQTIKMVNSPGAGSVMELCKLDYRGAKSNTGGYKTIVMLNDFVFYPGDQLQYTVSSALGDRTIIDTPTGDETYPFRYGSVGAPCPDMPTVTDIDGNVYNTVLIGAQCWLKENLKTTTYKNGTAIPNVTDDDEWFNLTYGAYVWYNNDTSWKDKYGALYNWYITINPNGLCPEGWHIPTNDEWTVLTEYLGGGVPPNNNELKSCRQVNSPLGDSCSTDEHPRWKEHETIYGTGDYGFEGLPGGKRHGTGFFHSMGWGGTWWAGAENSYDLAWSRTQWYHYSNVWLSNVEKLKGRSIRCVKD